MTDLGKQRRKQEAMTAVRHVEEALRRWDPIAGTPGAGAPADEYASYAPQIVSLLRGGASVTDVSAHLEHVRTVTIGLPADRTRDTECAEELIGWWKQHELGS